MYVFNYVLGVVAFGSLFYLLAFGHAGFCCCSGFSLAVAVVGGGGYSPVVGFRLLTVVASLVEHSL